MFTGPTPDITPAQILAVAGWIISQVFAYGALNARGQQVGVSVGATVLASVWKLADAYLRGQRAKAMIPPARAPITTTAPPNG